MDQQRVKEIILEEYAAKTEMTGINLQDILKRRGMDSMLFAGPLRLFLAAVLVIIEKDDVAVFRRVIHILKMVHKNVNTHLGSCLTPCFTRIIIELKRRLVLDKLRRTEMAGDDFMYGLIDKYFPHSKSDRCTQHKERTNSPDRVHFLKVRQQLLDLVHDKEYSHHVVPDAKKKELGDEVKRYVRAVNEEFPQTKIEEKRYEEAGNAPRKSKSSPLADHSSPSTLLHLKDCSVVLKNCNISCDEAQNEDTTHRRKRRIATCIPDTSPMSSHLHLLKDCLVQKNSKPMNTPTLSSAGLVTKVTRVSKSFDAHGRSNSKQRAEYMKHRRRLIISSHKGFPLISRTKAASQEKKQASGLSTTPDIDVAGPSSTHNFSVAGPSPNLDFSVACPSSTPDFSVSGLSSTLDMHVAGSSSSSDMNVACSSSTPNLDVAGPSSIYNFSAVGPSSTQNSNVAGPSTMPDIDVPCPSSMPDFSVACPSTSPDFSVAGVSSTPDLFVAGLSSTSDMGVAGPSSTLNSNVAGLSSTHDSAVAGSSTMPDMAVACLSSTPDLFVAGLSSTHNFSVTVPSSTPNSDVAGLSSAHDFSVVGPSLTYDSNVASPSTTLDIVDLSTSPNSDVEMGDDGSIILIEDDEEKEEEASFEKAIIELKERSFSLNSVQSTVRLRPCSVHLRKLNQLTVTHRRKLTIQNAGGPTIIKQKKYITRSIDVPGCGRIRLPDDLPECGLFRNVRVKL